MIESYLLEAFLAFANTGTLSAAAESLLISQPALSRSMKKLEEELGVTLFKRTKNSITLNENGQYFLQYVKRIYDLEDEAIRNTKSYAKQNSSIRIGSSIPGPRFLYESKLQQEFGDISIEFTLVEDLEQLWNDFQKNHYDLLFTHKPFPDSQYVCKHVFDERLGLSVLPANPIASFPEGILFKDVDGLTLLQESGVGYWNEIVKKNLSHCHIIYQENRQDLDALVQSSTLPTFITNITVSTRNSIDNRVHVFFQDDVGTLPIYAIYPKEKMREYSHIFK